MESFTFISNSPSETMKLAEMLAQRLKRKDVLTLEGDLGAGKTTFTKGLAKGLGIKRNINSPTFTIIKEYQGEIPLYHMDVYRLEGSTEDLGFEEYFDGDGVTVVEWAHLIEDQLPNELLSIHLYHQGDSNRRIILQPCGERFQKVCKEIMNESISD